MTTNAFAADVRVLTCPGCGAPLHVSPAGGHFTCEHCRNELDVAARTESGVGGPLLTDAERIQGLWGQVQGYESSVLSQAPPDLVQIVQAGPITEASASTALTMWQSYCNAAKSGNELAAEFAVIMTGKLGDYFGLAGDVERKRALLETTMEAMPTVALKEVIRCRLARAALKEGEVDAARAWLASCDPASADLEAYSEYRISTAFVATLDKDFSQVLELLGATASSLPSSPAPTLLMAVFRANAYEKNGDVDTAVAQLVDYVQQGGGREAGSLALVAQANAVYDLCPQAIPLAIAKFQASAPATAAAPAEEHKKHGLFGRHK